MKEIQTIVPEVVGDEFPKALKPAQKKTLADYIEKLHALNEYEALAHPESYLDDQSGRYVKMLEDLVEVAREAGLMEFMAATLFGLLKMTKVGRQKADVAVTGISKLRDEMDFKGKSDEELKEFLGK